MLTIPQVFLDVLAGLSPEEAKQQCERAGLRVRTTIVDGKFIVVLTRDYDPLRVNLEVENSIVRRATRG
jgi:hypothetical protein